MYTSIDDYLGDLKQKNQVVGTWGFDANRDFTKVNSEDTNVWFFEQVFNFLRSFFGVVMPDSIEITTYNATQQIKKDNLDQQTFLDELMLIMKQLKDPIWTLKLNLNLVGFLRTHNNLDELVRIQIQEPSSFMVWGGPDETGNQNFSISYSLFSDRVLEGSDEMMWSVNQPILQKSLRKWERQTGYRIALDKSNSPKAKTLPHGFDAPAPLKKAKPDEVSSEISDFTL